MAEAASENLDRLVVLRDRSKLPTAYLNVKIAEEELRILKATGRHENEIHDKDLEVIAKRNHYRNLCVEASVDPQL